MRKSVCRVASESDVKQILWLTKMGYYGSSERFYHHTLHIEGEWIVATDGNWLRILPNEEVKEHPPTDVQFEVSGKVIKLYTKPFDSFWYFPHYWKHFKPKDVDCSLTRERLVALLYQNDIYVNLDHLCLLENDRKYSYTVVEPDMIVIQDDLRRITVLPFRTRCE